MVTVNPELDTLLKRLSQYFLLAVTAMLLVLSLVACFGTFNILLELLSHLRIPLSILSILLVLVSIVSKSKTAILMNMVTLLLNLIPVALLYLPVSKSAQAASTVSLSLLQLNLRPYQNKNYDRALKVIKAKDADLVGVIELKQDWTKFLCRSLPEYPYLYKEEGFGGVMLMSKYKLLEPSIEYTGKIKRPRIRASIVKNGQSFNIILAHTVTQNDLRFRNKELHIVAEEAKSGQASSLIVFGDLNCSPFSPYFADLLKEGNLTDSEQGSDRSHLGPCSSALHPHRPCPD
ncbi:MAG: endonuclease/exonuclease/phosphatase family protein [Cyanobacteriota/Melainabacteria group bacterium]